MKIASKALKLEGEEFLVSPTIVGNQQLDHLCKDDASSSSSSSIVGLTRPGQLEKACTAACRLLELLKLLEQLFYASRSVLMMPLQAPTYVLKGAALPRPLKAMLKKEAAAARPLLALELIVAIASLERSCKSRRIHFSRRLFAC